MVIFFTIFHVIACLFLIGVVLLQSGKAADLAGAFGGMGSQTVFGPRGSATILSKLTTIAAAVFMVTSLTLSILATRGSSSPSILDKATKPAGAPTSTPSTVPIGVTPSVGGQTGQTKSVEVPVQTVPPGQAPTLPKQAPPTPEKGK